MILAAILAIGLVGCGNFRDLFSAHADVAAEAGGSELTSQRLAQIMSAGGKNVRVNRETADFLANAWVDYSLLGQAVARGTLPQDSASVASAVWPEISELKGTHWHDTLMARRSAVTDAEVDSLYNTTDVRVLQHILFGVRPNTEAGQRAATRKKAEVALARIHKGADFGTLASQLSEDPGSKADSGYLPPSPKGRFVATFDSAGWTLQPGQVSGLVETPFGYHILRRPALADVRPRVREFLVQRAGARLDSLYMDSLAQSNKISVVKDAPATIRSALEDPDGSRNSGKALVHYTGGTLNTKDFLRWVRALPPQYSVQLRQADDSMLTKFARLLTQNVLLLREADSAGIKITPEEWNSLRGRYQSQVDSLKAEMGLGADASDSTASPAEREKAAALRVERYFDRLMEGKARLRPIPSALATLLRERLPYTVHDAGVTRAYELAGEAKAKSDSSAPKTGMQRAPGGPPVPGLQPAPGGQAPGASSPGSQKPATPSAPSPSPASPQPEKKQ
jgi:hypothetical protein